MAQSKILERIISHIDRYRIFERGRTHRVVVGCSGGPDSAVLLHVLFRVRELYGLTLIPVHVDHLLRKESQAEAQALYRHVRERYGLETAVFAVPVARIARRGKTGTEEAGRLVRRRILEEVAGQAGLTRIALGHHRDDQAETVIFRIARGAGIRGVCGMRPLAGMYARPLLDLSKDDIRACVSAEKLYCAEDRSNGRLDYSRNLIRHRIMPVLTKVNQSAVQHICEFSETAREFEEHLEEMRQQMERQHFLFSGEGFRVYDAAILSGSGLVSREAVRAVYEAFTGSLAGIDRRHIDEFAGEKKKNFRMNFPRDVVLAKQFGIVIAIDKGLKLGGYSMPFREGASRLPLGLGTLRLELTGESGKPLPRGMRIRSFMPGDRMDGRKLKELFQDLRLPREFRNLIPLLAADGGILYSPLLHGSDATVSIEGHRLKISFIEGQLYSKIKNLILTRPQAL